MTGPGPEPDLRRFILDQTRTLDRERLLARLDAGDDPAMVQRDAAASAAEVRRRRAALPRPRFDQALPILARRDEIAEAIREHAVVVVCGETGSGKTTQLPQMCLDLGRGAAGMIAHTQPRRIAARAVASRIAEELAVPLGGTVGVKVRFDDRTSPATAIKIMTDGMLLAETQQDPGLWAYDTVIIDEAHERSLNIDFLLGYLRTLRSTRPDLRVIITSATIDPARFAAFFAGPRGPAPVLNVSGRTYPVEVRYRPALSRDDDTPEVSPDAVARAVEELSGPALPPGDILAFLPGEREIRQCADALARARGGWEVLPLYARLSAPEQDRVFHPTPGVRRVILSTNVAETSLTVPGIRYVVDTGLVRLARYDPKARVQRLPIELVSRASADQRSGRCGRQAAGVAIRLYDRRDLDAAPAFTEPEVLRSDLAGVLLQMLALRLGPIESFPFLDAPEAGAVADARLTLFELGAVDGPGPEGRLTPLGERLARLPLEPRVGRMLLAAQVEGALEEVIVLASFFSIQDPRERPLSAADRADLAREVFRDPDSDFMSLLKLWDQYRHAAERGSRGELAAWCREHFLSPARMREWSDVARQLKDAAEELDLRPASGPASPEAIHRALLTGLIANVCCRDEGLGQHEYRGFRGNVVSLFPGSVLFKKNPRWIVAAEIVQTTRLYARTLARIDPAWVEELAGHVMQRQLTDRHYDKQTHAACVWERVSMAGIVVVPRRKVPLAPLDPAAARGVFIRDGLASGALDGIPFAEHNRAVLARAADLEARLRRRGLCRSPDNLADWFDARLPPEVVDAASLRAWLTPERDAALRLDERDVLRPDALFAADPALFPDSLTLAGDTCPVVYRFEPGHDDDGVTVTVPLRALPDLTPDRAEWLVPGLLADKVLAALKALPKPDRARVEAAGDPRALSADLAGVLEFGVGPLGAALSDAAKVLRGVEVPAASWTFAAVPEHLRLRVRVVSEGGHEIAAGRDVDALHDRLAGRIAKLREAQVRAGAERAGLTAWTFGDLPEATTVEQQGATLTRHPALVDEGASVRLTLMDDPARALAASQRGVRRLFALACADEVSHRMLAMPAWREIERWHAALGPSDRLLDDAVCLVSERCFLSGQPLPRTAPDFEERLQARWGRLAQSAIEVTDVLAGMLEPRFRVAGRLSGGVSRHWAASVADLREHAAYLMPRGFLGLLPWERLRDYPRYAQAMWQRLLALREDGSGAEAGALRALAPRWKRFTAWVAQAQSAERRAAQAAGEVRAAPRAGKAPLPQARRAAPAVNLEAGEWTIQPGRLPPLIEGYRWAVEDFRVGLFAPSLGGPRVDEARLDALWERASTAGP